MMDRVKVLRFAARYAERYAQSQDAIRAPAVAKEARAVRTELLNMADEIEYNRDPERIHEAALAFDAFNNACEHKRNHP